MNPDFAIEPDVRIHDAGSVVMVEPVTPAAHDWVTDHVTLEPWQWMGGAFACEPRLLGGLIQWMQNDGLAVEGL